MVLTVGADTGGPVLLLDYPGRRPEAPVTALRLDDGGYRTLPLLTQPLPVEVTGRAYAERLVALHSPGMSSARAVVAYCAASALAVHVVHLLREHRGWAPALVFLDATPTSAADVTDAYATATRQVPGGGEPPDGEPPALPEHPARLLQEAREDLSRRAAAALRAQGLGEDVTAGPAAHFADQHVAYLAYLLAARGPVPREPVAPMLHVLSRGHHDHRDWLPGGELHTAHVDSDRAGLAAHPSARNAVLSFLDRAVTPGSAGHIPRRRQYP